MRQHARGRRLHHTTKIKAAKRGFYFAYEYRKRMRTSNVTDKELTILSADFANDRLQWSHP